MLNFERIQKDFLVYNRAWSGTREYRLKFTEQIVASQLQENCLMTFNPVCEKGHYKDFTPKNPNLKIQCAELENYFDLCRVTGTASADYNNDDYQTTAIEVVLETLFDDSRWHLTEKALRPIACGRPFILAAPLGSLIYLRRYGFKTFDGLINEHYDTVKDPVERLESICLEMKRISQLPENKKRQLWTELYKIARYNQELFFDVRWQDGIFDEFVCNLKSGLDILAQYKTGKHWRKNQAAWMANPDKFQFADKHLLESMKHQQEVEQLIRQ